MQLLMATVVSLGGAISGEHGIGLAKTPFLRIQHSPAQISAMQAVKAALDPRGILNRENVRCVSRVETREADGSFAVGSQMSGVECLWQPKFSEGEPSSGTTRERF